MEEKKKEIQNQIKITKIEVDQSQLIQFQKKKKIKICLLTYGNKDLFDIVFKFPNLLHLFIYVTNNNFIGGTAFTEIPKLKTLRITGFNNLDKYNINMITKNKSLENIEIETNYNEILKNKKIKFLKVKKLSGILNVSTIKYLYVNELSNFKTTGECKHLQDLEIRCDDNNFETIKNIINMANKSLKRICIYICSPRIGINYLLEKIININTIKLKNCLRRKLDFDLNISNFTQLKNLKLHGFRLNSKIENIDNLKLTICEVNFV